MKLLNTVKNVVMNGTFGNLCKSVFTNAVTLAKDAVAAVARMPEGVLITGFVVNYAALGASTGLKFGIAYFDGTDADDDFFGTVASTSSAGVFTYSGKPLKITKPFHITITATGAAVSGEVTVVTEYIFEGEG